MARDFAFTHVWGTLALGALLMLPVSSFCQSRTWTSDQGSTVKAELVDINTNSVTLARADGKGNITVLIRNLSQADQAFIARDWAVERMSNVIIPESDFRQTPLPEVIQFLAAAAKPSTNGAPTLTIQLHSSVTNASTVTFTARQIKLLDTLKLITNITGTKYTVNGKTVLVMAKDEPEGPLLSRTYPFTLSRQQVQSSTIGGSTDQGVRKLLEMMGVQFPRGSQVHVDWDNRRMEILTTAQSHAVIAKNESYFAVAPLCAKHLTRLWEISNADAAKLAKVLHENAVSTQQMPNPNMRKALQFFESIRKSEITAFQKVFVAGAKEHEWKRVGNCTVILDVCIKGNERGSVLWVSTELAVVFDKRIANLAAAGEVKNAERFLTLAQDRGDGTSREDKWYVIDIIVRLVNRDGSDLMVRP